MIKLTTILKEIKSIAGGKMLDVIVWTGGKNIPMQVKILAPATLPSELYFPEYYSNHYFVKYKDYLMVAYYDKEDHKYHINPDVSINDIGGEKLANDAIKFAKRFHLKPYVDEKDELDEIKSLPSIKPEAVLNLIADIRGEIRDSGFRMSEKMRLMRFLEENILNEYKFKYESISNLVIKLKTLNNVQLIKLYQELVEFKKKLNDQN